MALTHEELSRRRNFVTASDVACILGASEHKNAVDVWYEKLGLVEDFEGNAATDAGNRFEDVVRTWAGEKLGGIVRGDWCVHEGGTLAATMDSMTLNREPVECKTSGLVSPGYPHLWGDEGTDEVPQEYLLQVHAQMIVVKAEVGYIPAFIAGRGFSMFRFGRNDDLHGYILDECEKFMQMVANRQRPDVIPHMDTIKRMIRRPEATIDIPDGLVERYEAASLAAKEADAAKEAAKTEMLAALGDHECGRFGGGIVTYLQQTRKGYVVNDSTFRVARIKRAK